MTRNFDELVRHDVHSFANRAHVELHGSPLGDDMYVRLLTTTSKASFWDASGATFVICHPDTARHSCFP
jgi:hypothetical protein